MLKTGSVQTIDDVVSEDWMICLLVTTMPADGRRLEQCGGTASRLSIYDRFLPASLHLTPIHSHDHLKMGLGGFEKRPVDHPSSCLIACDAFKEDKHLH